MQLERNKPCFCGSGKKYKKGCLFFYNNKQVLQHRIQAAKTKQGREKLNMLLIQFERDLKNNPIEGDSVENTQNIRKKLKL